MDRELVLLKYSQWLTLPLLNPISTMSHFLNSKMAATIVVYWTLLAY